MYGDNKKLRGIKMFGCEIQVDNGMMRLKDIQMAYCKESGDNEDSTEPKEWRRTKSAEALIGYLDDLKRENPTLKSIDYPRGKKGGIYVCRELAHDYARWLDVRYAYHILRAFDQLVDGNWTEAAKTAQKVAQKIKSEDWNARYDRIESAGLDIEDYINCLVAEIEYALTEHSGHDPKELAGYLATHPDGGMIFERMLNSMETAWHCIGDNNEARERVIDQYREDPGMETLSRLIKDFYKK